jgi:esterase/lipase
VEGFDELTINTSTYQWSVRIVSIIKRLLSVNIKMHQDRGQIADGEIFLFNHFARFETFIPQYLIYQEDGSYCRSIAAKEFFSEDDAFSSFLLSVGAVPNKYPKLMPFLAGEILRGRKVIIFPEGGMVKDRRVCDDKGRFSIYSRSSMERRKHHTGAAVLSLKVDVLKGSIKHAFNNNDDEIINYWVRTLEFGSREQLLSAVQRKSTIVPANITFYPLRVDDNILRRGVELFNSGISKRLSEELLIEGNILLKNTDMDIRLGDVISTEDYWRGWERSITHRCAKCIKNLDDLLVPNPAKSSMQRRFLSARIRHNSLRLRDSYMRAMYVEVTINMSHLAALIIYSHLERSMPSVERNSFHHMLYLAVKYVQELKHINLHRSLKNPDAYAAVLEGKSDGLTQFFKTAEQLELIEIDGDNYRFLPKLCIEHDFDLIRTENMVEVYANEARPVAGIREIINNSIRNSRKLDKKQLAKYRFSDMQISYAWDKKVFNKPHHQVINQRETATDRGDPFFVIPGKHKDLGVVLTHGFLATPAEVRAFGEQLSTLGYPVIGPRLKGHGTSPWDLRIRSWEDWLKSLREAYEIMSAHCSRICLIGFSSGGALSLLLASEQLPSLAGVVAISAPIKFVDKNMMFVPFVNAANRLSKWLPAYEGIMPFRYNNKTEHPNVNYRSMPVHALFELRLMVSHVERCLSNVHCPALILQADQDPVVEPESADIIMDKLGSREKRLEIIQSTRHGTIYEDIGNSRNLIVEYLENLGS